MSAWPTFLTIPRAPDFVIGEPDDLYLRRWWAIPRNRWFNVYLHNFRRSDDDRALHDHRFANCSIILTGAYFEHLQDGSVRLRKAWRPWAPWRLVFRRATAAHRVELIQGGDPVWTLFVTGPVRRDWGFHCPRGWVPWREFVSIRPGGNSTGKGCE